MLFPQAADWHKPCWACSFASRQTDGAGIQLQWKTICTNYRSFFIYFPTTLSFKIFSEIRKPVGKLFSMLARITSEPIYPRIDNSANSFIKMSTYQGIIVLNRNGNSALFLLRTQVYKLLLLHQGIVYLSKNRNSATFFSYVCNPKKFIELFLSYLNWNDC